MATIKLEILLDSNEQTDVLAFSNLMNAFSGTPAVQVIQTGEQILSSKKVLQEAGQEVFESLKNLAETVIKTDDAENTDYTEAEMMKLPNTDLKDYATSLGIDWAKAEGKNTNRKLADLVLSFRNGETKEEESTTEGFKDEAPTETAEDLTKEDDLAGEKLTYNDLKVSLGKKVDEHRDAIVAELAKFGATKMPNLDEKHWEAMYNFMEAL